MPDPVCQMQALCLPVSGPGRPVDQCLMPGDVLLVDGAPEAGKSTLLKVLAGLLHPRSGEAILFGRHLRNESPAGLRRLRERLGVVFERDGLIPSWSVLDNLLLPLRYRRPDRENEHRARLDDCLPVIHEPADILSKRVSTLTARQRRRLALLRALLLEPTLLLLDDLPNHLGDNEVAVNGILAHLNDGQRTIVACAPARWREHFSGDRVYTLHLGTDTTETGGVN